MNDQWQMVIERRNQVCEEFKDCDGAGSRAFAAVGISVSADGPRLIVFSSDIPATKGAIAAGPGHDWVDTVQFEDSDGFHTPVGPSVAGRSAHRPTASPGPVAPNIEIGAGTEVGSAASSGTVGCVLLDTGRTPYYLTAGHVLPRAGDTAYYGATPIGCVVGASTVPTGLDWSLIRADLSAAQPTDAIVYDCLTLSPPLGAGDLPLLAKQTIGMSGATSKERRLGTVVSVSTCLVVTKIVGSVCKRYVFDDQIIVKSATARRFGPPGDSGAVAYLNSALKASAITYPEGAAIGLYWREDAARDLHALAPIPDILKAIKDTTQLQLSLLP